MHFSAKHKKPLQISVPLQFIFPPNFSSPCSPSKLNGGIAYIFNLFLYGFKLAVTKSTPFGTIYLHIFKNMTVTYSRYYFDKGNSSHICIIASFMRWFTLFVTVTRTMQFYHFQYPWNTPEIPTTAALWNSWTLVKTSSKPVDSKNSVFPAKNLVSKVLEIIFPPKFLNYKGMSLLHSERKSTQFLGSWPWNLS